MAIYSSPNRFTPTDGLCGAGGEATNSACEVVPGATVPLSPAAQPVGESEPENEGTP